MPVIGAIKSEDTLSELAANRVRKAILSGHLPPGSRLHIQNLATEFGFSSTPMREALTRLTTNGLVQAHGQKGFRVLPITLRDFEDIQRLRHLVEIEALTLSMANGGLEWESEIVSALHRLKSLSANDSDLLPEGEAQFDQTHKEFHTALLAACGSPRLLTLHSDLHDQIYRYRVILRITRRRKDTSHKDHDALAHHVLARNLEAAVKTLHEHIDLTTMGVKILTPQVLQSTFPDADTSQSIKTKAQKASRPAG